MYNSVVYLVGCSVVYHCVPLQGGYVLYVGGITEGTPPSRLAGSGCVCYLPGPVLHLVSSRGWTGLDWTGLWTVNYGSVNCGPWTMDRDLLTLAKSNQLEMPASSRAEMDVTRSQPQVVAIEPPTLTQNI